MEGTPAPETDASVDRPRIDYEDLANWENEDAVDAVQPQDGDVYGYNDETIDQSFVPQLDEAEERAGG